MGRLFSFHWWEDHFLLVNSSLQCLLVSSTEPENKFFLSTTWCRDWTMLKSWRGQINWYEISTKDGEQPTSIDWRERERERERLLEKMNWYKISSKYAWQMIFSYSWIHQYWPTIKDLDSPALYEHWMSSRRLAPVGMDGENVKEVGAISTSWICVTKPGTVYPCSWKYSGSYRLWHICRKLEIRAAKM